LVLSQDVQLTDVAFADPNLMIVAPSTNPVPVTVTLVPPAVVPPFGVSFVIVGVNPKRSADETTLEPPDVVTVTSTLPADSTGETAVIEVAEFTLKLVALVEPNLTAVTPMNSVPVIITLVPPATAPWCGDTFVTAGTPAITSIETVATAGLRGNGLFGSTAEKLKLSDPA